MLADLGKNLLAFIASVPINLVIILVICIVLKLFGVRIVDLIKIVIAYFVICFILSLLGLSLPSIPALLKWIKDVIVSIYHSDFIQNLLRKLVSCTSR